MKYFGHVKLVHVSQHYLVCIIECITYFLSLDVEHRKAEFYNQHICSVVYILLVYLYPFVLLCDNHKYCHLSLDSTTCSHMQEKTVEESKAAMSLI